MHSIGHRPQPVIVLGVALWLGAFATVARAKFTDDANSTKLVEGPSATGALTLLGKLVTAYDACALIYVCSTSGTFCDPTASGSDSCVGGGNPGASCTSNADCQGTCDGGTNAGLPCSTETDCNSNDCDNFGSCITIAGCPAAESCVTPDRGQVGPPNATTSSPTPIPIPACTPPRRSDPVCGFNQALTTAAGTLTTTVQTTTGDLNVVGTLAGLGTACKGHRLRLTSTSRLSADNVHSDDCTVSPASSCTANGTSSACHNPNYGCTGNGTPKTCCTGNGTGSCPTDNSNCTGAGTPFWCCTGAGNGTCGPDSTDPCQNVICNNLPARVTDQHKGAPCCSGNGTGACGPAGTIIDLIPALLDLLGVPVECRVGSGGACNINTSMNRAIVSSHCTGKGTADGGNAACCTNAKAGNCTQAACTGVGTPFSCCNGAGNTTTQGCNFLKKGNRIVLELKDAGVTRVTGNNVIDNCAAAGKTETGNATCCTGARTGNCTGAVNCVAANNPFPCCTGNGTGPDCQQPTNYANYYCTGAGTPASCCTGDRTGTCSKSDCTGSRTPFDCCGAPGTGCQKPDYSVQKTFSVGLFDP